MVHPIHDCCFDSESVAAIFDSYISLVLFVVALVQGGGGIVDKEAWEAKQKRIEETAKQIAAILAKNGVTYNEVPQIFGKAQDYLVVNKADSD